MRQSKFGRLELMWANWTSSFFDSGYVAGGWLRCWYIWRLRIGWRLKQPNRAEWDAQPTTTQTVRKRFGTPGGTA